MVMGATRMNLFIFFLIAAKDKCDDVFETQIEQLVLFFLYGAQADLDYFFEDGPRSLYRRKD
jgi:hypothetical protein